MNNQLKILLADDHDLVREGLKITLADLPGTTCMLEAATAREVNHTLASHQDIDLIILDLNMPGARDLELLSELCDTCPKIPIVVLSAEESPCVMQRAIDRGAAGFIPKSSANSVLVSALQLILSGGIYIPSTMVTVQDTGDPGESANEPLSGGPHTGPFEFTDRQRDVLTLLAGGYSNKMIAKQLGLSEHTVKVHMTAILRILGVSNRTEAAIVCRELGLVSEE